MWHAAGEDRPENTLIFAQSYWYDQTADAGGARRGFRRNYPLRPSSPSHSQRLL